MSNHSVRLYAEYSEAAPSTLLLDDHTFSACLAGAAHRTYDVRELAREVPRRDCLAAISLTLMSLSSALLQTSPTPSFPIPLSSHIHFKHFSCTLTQAQFEASIEEFNISSYNVRAMEQLSVSGCLNHVIPFGVYEGMGHQESAGATQLC